MLPAPKPEPPRNFVTQHDETILPTQPGPPARIKFGNEIDYQSGYKIPTYFQLSRGDYTVAEEIGMMLGMWLGPAGGTAGLALGTAMGLGHDAVHLPTAGGSALAPVFANEGFPSPQAGSPAFVPPGSGGSFNPTPLEAQGQSPNTKGSMASTITGGYPTPGGVDYNDVPRMGEFRRRR